MIKSFPMSRARSSRSGISPFFWRLERRIRATQEAKVDDCMDAGGRATQEAKAGDCMDAGGRATQEAKAGDCMDAGGRATQEAKAGDGESENEKTEIPLAPFYKGG